MLVHDSYSSVDDASAAEIFTKIQNAFDSTFCHFLQVKIVWEKVSGSLAKLNCQTPSSGKFSVSQPRRTWPTSYGRALVNLRERNPQKKWHKKTSICHSQQWNSVCSKVFLYSSLVFFGDQKRQLHDKWNGHKVCSFKMTWCFNTASIKKQNLSIFKCLVTLVHSGHHSIPSKKKWERLVPTNVKDIFGKFSGRPMFCPS